MSKSSLAENYVHGFTKIEQDRLFKQARMLEDTIFSNVDFSKAHSVIEIGIGVGAQTQIMLERYPKLKIFGLDASASQVDRARTALAEHVGSGRVQVDVGDALHLRYDDNNFDGAFICWFLEHVQKPIEILKEVRRVLKPGGALYCNEPLNTNLYIHPYSPATLKFWFEFNDYQWTMKGDPFVGGKLGNYLQAAGFQNIETKVLTSHFDNRMPKKRSAYIDYWSDLMLSAAPGLIEAGRIDETVVKEMTKELQTLKSEPESVIFDSWILARAEAH